MSKKVIGIIIVLDLFYNQFNAQVDLLQSLNKDIEVKVLDG